MPYGSSNTSTEPRTVLAAASTMTTRSSSYTATANCAVSPMKASPSGCVPTATSAVFEKDGRSMIVTVPLSWLAHASRRPSAEISIRLLEFPAIADVCHAIPARHNSTRHEGSIANLFRCWSVHEHGAARGPFSVQENGPDSLLQTSSCAGLAPANPEEAGASVTS